MGLLTVLLLGVFAATASAGTPSAFTWDEHQLIDPGNDLVAISCPSERFCAAVDTQGNALVSADPTGGADAWHRVKVVAEHRLLGISCASPELCVAFDDAGNVISTKDPAGGPGAWKTAHLADEPSFEPEGGSATWGLRGISCPTTSLCVAVDRVQGRAFTATDPTAGASAWTAEDVDKAACPQDGTGCPWFEGGLTGISCASESLCVAIDDISHVLTSTNPTGGAVAWKVTDSGARQPCRTASRCSVVLWDVSCRSASFCVATGDGANVLTSTHPTGNASDWRVSLVTEDLAIQYYQGVGPNTAACASPMLCLASTGSRTFTSTDPVSGPWSDSDYPRVADVECPTESLCIVVSAGSAIVGRPRPAVPPTPADPTVAVDVKPLLRRVLLPRGRGGRIAALLRRRSYTVSFDAPAAGTVAFTWVARPGGMIASGRRTFGGAGSGAVKLRLTRRGVKLLGRKKRVKVRAIGTFMPSSGTTTSTSRAFVLRR